jgi:hypothetical protein
MKERRNGRSSTAAAGSRWPDDEIISYYSGSDAGERASAMPDLQQIQKTSEEPAQVS